MTLTLTLLTNIDILLHIAHLNTLSHRSLSHVALPVHSIPHGLHARIMSSVQLPTDSPTHSRSYVRSPFRSDLMVAPMPM